MKDQTTEILTAILLKTGPDKLEEYFEKYADSLTESEKPFTDYMRGKIKEKERTQKDVFIAADISNSFGYKLISGETPTLQRDIIIRICLASHFLLDETQQALILYGMSPLSPRIRRDAVLIVAINSRIYEMDAVNELLRKYGQEKLYAGKNAGTS